MNTCLYYLLYIASLGSHTLYIFISIQISLHLLHIDGVDHLIRVIPWRYMSEPSSFFVLFFASIHPQESTSTYASWPSPPKMRYEYLDVDICASVVRKFASQFFLLHLLARLWFTAAGCFRLWWRICWRKGERERYSHESSLVPNSCGPSSFFQQKKRGRVGCEPSTSELVVAY